MMRCSGMFVWNKITVTHSFQNLTPPRFITFENCTPPIGNNNFWNAPPPSPHLQPLLDQVSSSIIGHIGFISYKIPIVSSVAWDFEGARRERKFSVPESAQIWGSPGGMLPHKMFEFRVSEMPSPAFLAGHFQQIKTKENAVISCLF